MDRVNAHHPFELPEAVGLATVDVSFISLQKVLPNVIKVLDRDGLLITLFKPQFEVGRDQVGKGGIVRDPAIHAAALGRFLCWVLESGLRPRGLVPSPVLGAEGNQEFLVMLRRR
jgi:23S rRNA (cytidine1920-2'-O)/16S rRNA (cytidine1409-2'-O)-methyltransferase